jgi:hypothetical protein
VGIVTAISFVITPIYYIVTFKWKNGTKQLFKWFGLMALSFDQFGNVTCSKVLDLTMLKKDRDFFSMKFGDEDDTVSYVLAINKERKTLSRFGRFIGNLLDLLDKNHLEKAIENKKRKDGEAYFRANNNLYI